MDLYVDDDGFVRAPRSLVYRRLTDIGAWPDWWRGVRVRSMPPRQGDETWGLELAGRRTRRLRVAARAHGWRHNEGFALALAGDLEAHAEFWLEEVGGGTVVHHVLTGRTPLRRPLQVHADYRRALRRGLWGLKDALQLEARSAAGLEP